jgi:uncharacterized membrane protein YecN with MAPEG domain
MNLKQLVSVIVALVISTSIASAAWWLVWSIGFASIAGGMAGAVGILTGWYAATVAYNAIRREVWL